METISLNGKWMSRHDVENLGKKQEWYNLKNYIIHKNNLINAEIPKYFNFLI